MEPIICVISPHRDDAVISLGATLHQLVRQQVTINIVTCFSRSVYAPFAVPPRTTDEVTELRASEDSAALNVLGIDRNRCIAFPFPDASCRGVCEQDILWPERSFERQGQYYAAQIAQALKQKCSDNWLIVPLSARNTHVDHRISTSGTLLGSSARIVGCYADLPYALGLTEEETSVYVRSLAGEVGEPLQAVSLNARESSVAKRIALQKYSSQFCAEYILGLEALISLRGGEGLWLKPSVISYLNIVERRRL
jgi:LmbE family N-acetylglucosaminyl deacetylase